MFGSFTRLGHWLRLLLKKEEHLSFVFCTEEIQMLIRNHAKNVGTILVPPFFAS